MADRAGLAGQPPAGAGDVRVVLAGGLGDLERLLEDPQEHVAPEVLLDGALVDEDLPVPGNQSHPGDAGLAAARGGFSLDGGGGGGLGHL